MLWMTDGGNYKAHFNRAWLAFTGLEQKQAAGSGWLDAVHPSERDACASVTLKHLRTRQPLLLEYRLRRHDGEYRWVMDHCTPRYDSQGRFACCVGDCTDITELRAAAANASRWQTRFEAALVANGWVWFEGDGDSVHVRWSPAITDLLGYPAEEVSTREQYIALMHPEDRERTVAEFWALRGSASHGAHYYRVRHRDGYYLWLEARFYFVRDAQGEVLTTLGFVIDVSDRVRAEEQLRSSEERFRLLNSELEQRVADRTASLRATNEELEAFTYSVSHDLRAPLRHLSGFADLLRGRLTVRDSDVERYLDTITGSAVRMGEMIDQLLALSRVGRGEMHPVSVDLRHMANELVAELTPAAAGRRIDWRIGALPVVHADRTLLRSALLNLLANAVKFTHGRETAVIELAGRSSEREHEITVTDNGAGFDMKYADRLFGVFQRLHGPGEFDGTGVGLASVKRIITRHGGRVWANGAPDKGSSFHFTLPAREDT